MLALYRSEVEHVGRNYRSGDAGQIGTLRLVSERAAKLLFNSVGPLKTAGGPLLS